MSEPYWEPLAAAPAAPAGALTLLAEQALAAPAANVTFASIPQTHKHLLLVGRYIFATSANKWLWCRINGISGNTYGGQSLQANSTTVAAAGYADTALRLALGWNIGWLKALFPDYTNAALAQVVTCDYGATYDTATVPAPTGAGGFLTGNVSGYLAGAANLAALTQLQLLDSAGGNLAAGTRFSLYGLS